MPHAPPAWTVEALRALADGGRRYELVAGELLPSPKPSWPQQNARDLLRHIVASYLQQHALGEVRVAPQELPLDRRTLVRPDLFVLARRPEGERRRARPAPILVVEISSPAVASVDRGVKRRRYLEAGVGEYWIVDVDERRVERWRPGASAPEAVTDRLRWQPDPATAAFELYLPAFFSEALRED